MCVHQRPSVHETKNMVSMSLVICEPYYHLVGNRNRYLQTSNYEICLGRDGTNLICLTKNI